MIQCLYSKKFNIEFYHIPKCGMTSVINNLDMKWYEISNLPKNREVLCIVRNPLTRLVSSYLELRDVIYPNQQINLYSYVKLSNCQYKSMFGTNIFLGFIKYIFELKKNFFDLHNVPQAWFINPPVSNNLSLNKIKHRSFKQVTNLVRLKDLSNIILKYNLKKNIRKNKKQIVFNKKKIITKFLLLMLSIFFFAVIYRIYKQDFIIYRTSKSF